MLPLFTAPVIYVPIMQSIQRLEETDIPFIHTVLQSQNALRGENLTYRCYDWSIGMERASKVGNLDDYVTSTAGDINPASEDRQYREIRGQMTEDFYCEQQPSAHGGHFTVV